MKWLLYEFQVFDELQNEEQMQRRSSQLKMQLMQYLWN